MVRRVVVTDGSALQPSTWEALSLRAKDHGLRRVGLSGLRCALRPVVSDGFRRLTHRSELRNAHGADDHFVDVAHSRFRHSSVGYRSYHPELGRRRNAVSAILAWRAGRSLRSRWSSRSNGSCIALVAFVSLWARAASQSDT
jgi:hypothetical protein